MEWTLLGNASGTSPIESDYAKYKELKICARFIGDGACNIVATDVLTSMFLMDKNNWFFFGTYISEQTNMGAVVYGTLQKLQLAKFQNNNIDYTENSELLIYGRV